MVLFDIFKAWENLYCIIIIIHFNNFLDWIISLKKNKQEEIIVHNADIFTAKMKSYLH